MPWCAIWSRSRYNLCMQEQEEGVVVRISGKPYRLTLNAGYLREHLMTLGYSHKLCLKWTKGKDQGGIEHLSESEDVVYINPHFIILIRLGVCPLPWPAALCPAPLYKKRLLQTLAHELRHAQQYAGLTGSSKEPWLSYEFLKYLGWVYIGTALIGTLVTQWLLSNNAVLQALYIGIGLIILGLVYVVLAYFNYHLDPKEVDARTYERKNWKEWDDCLRLEAQSR